MSGILVHEWLAPTGGSENVFETLCETFPDAERFCLWNDSEGRFDDVHETALAHTPLRRSKSLSVPFMPIAWRHLPARDADWILCSTHAFSHHAKFAGPAADAPKLVYAHTPARYVWVPELDRRGDRFVARAVSTLLRPLDRRRAAEPQAIACNSEFVRKRIQAAWFRDADVIYPPVEVARLKSASTTFTPVEQRALESLPSDFILGVSRFIPYKRLDLVIEAGALAGIPVVLAGEGPEEAHLRQLAEGHPGQVTFVGRPSDALLRELYRRASVLVFPPIEDFGIVPIEAMAMGTPVVANAAGGAAESVLDGVTGALVENWQGAQLRQAVATASSCDARTCAARADDFDTSVFVRRIRDWVSENTGQGK